MAAEDGCERDMFPFCRGARWPFLSHNGMLSIQANQQRKPSATGITGCPRVIASDLRTATESSRRFVRDMDFLHQIFRIQANTERNSRHAFELLWIDAPVYVRIHRIHSSREATGFCYLAIGHDIGSSRSR